jgi:hypothetical protein
VKGKEFSWSSLTKGEEEGVEAKRVADLYQSIKLTLSLF